MLILYLHCLLFSISLAAPQVRIVGSQQAERNQFPYQAAIRLHHGTREEPCGGSLISDQFVLTAASCVNVATQVDVILGAYNLSDTEKSQIRFDNVQVIRHENYQFFDDYNIALLKLPAKVDLTDSINVVQLSSANDLDYVGDTAVLSGWGSDNTGGPFDPPKYNEILSYIENAVISNDECSLEFPLNIAIKPSHVCVSGKGLKLPCTGDTGSPIVDNGIQIGLVSVWSPDCAREVPFVNTRISSYRDWITRHAGV